MLWLDSARFPLIENRWKETLLTPALVSFGGLLFSVVTAGGFLYIVGFHVIAMAIAFIPVLLVGGLLLCVSAGYLWEVLDNLYEHLNDFEWPELFDEWPRYAWQGFHLLLFYGLLGLFLVSSTIAFYPFGLAIPVLTLIFHPLMMAPMLFSRNDRTFLGLVDGCLDALSMLNDTYLLLWAEMTVYTLVFGVILMPVCVFLLTVSVVGILFVPGVLLAFMMGLGYLLSNAIPDLKAETCPPMPQPSKPNNNQAPLSAPVNIYTKPTRQGYALPHSQFPGDPPQRP